MRTRSASASAGEGTARAAPTAAAPLRRRRRGAPLPLATPLGFFGSLPRDLLVRLLLSLPLDARLRFTALSRAWRDMLRQDWLRSEAFGAVSFCGVTSSRGSDDDQLASLLARLNGGLRSLDVSEPRVCARLTPRGVVAALRGAREGPWEVALEKVTFLVCHDDRGAHDAPPLIEEGRPVFSRALLNELLAVAERLTHAIGTPFDGDKTLLRASANLQEVRFSRNGLPPTAGPTLTLVRWSCVKSDALSAALAEIGPSAALDAEHVRLSAGHLTVMLAPPFALEHVGLYRCSIPNGGVRVLAAALSAGARLRSLRVTDDVGDDGATALSASVAANTHLEVLKLTSCAIGDGGATALATALGTNSSLQELDICQNHFGVAGATAFAAALARNAALRTLFMGATLGKTAEDALELAHAMRTAPLALKFYVYLVVRDQARSGASPSARAPLMPRARAAHVRCATTARRLQGRVLQNAETSTAWPGAPWRHRRVAAQV